MNKTNRKAKIVATLGPSTNTIEKIEALIKAGMDVARINMSHGTYEVHAQTIKNIRQASKNCQREIGVLLDLQGPKIRVDKLAAPLKLNEGEHWVIGASQYLNLASHYDGKFIPTVYEKLVDDAVVGAQILFDDGNLAAKVIEKLEHVIKIEVTVGGELKSNKGINLPDIKVSAPSFTEKDQEDLMFGLQQKIDFVALSFVRTADDIYQVKSILHKMKVAIPIISKIEKPEAIENFDDILKMAEMVMIARGDMGVEVGNHLVPSIQKDIITRCNQAGVPVITATQMLESMIDNPRPTRAEASDVANAIWDGTDAVMLSGETAAGKYPIETVKMMHSIVVEAESRPKERPLLRHIDLSSVTSAQMVAASLIAEKVHAKWIISATQGGNSCLKMTRFRPHVPVLGMTNSISVLRRMNLYWGITPYLMETEDEDVTFDTVDGLKRIAKNLALKNGDKIVITHGDGKYFQHGLSNLVRVEIIKDLETKEKSHDIDRADFNNGSILLDTQLCSSCQNCISVCPHGIYMASTDEKRDTLINHVNVERCTLDFSCVETCPTGAIEIIPKNGYDEV
jgi:pyruvate kinase